MSRFKHMEDQGFQIVYSQESWGQHHTGIAVCVLLPHRIGDDDSHYFWDVRKSAENAVAKVLYEKDPERSERESDAKKELLSCFGDRPIFVEEIPNEYWGENAEPWLLVTTSIGHTKIGWRKRVISIDWSRTVVEKTPLELFPNEKVTMFDRGIHAWGLDKATEYLSAIHGNR